MLTSHRHGLQRIADGARPNEIFDITLDTRPPHEPAQTKDGASDTLVPAEAGGVEPQEEGAAEGRGHEQTARNSAVGMTFVPVQRAGLQCTFLFFGGGGHFVGCGQAVVVHS
jgi:hypothetical protein